MYEQVMCRIESLPPLGMLQNNGQKADWRFAGTKRIATISKKRNKTEADFLDLQKVEWEAGLYLNEDGRVIVPEDWLAEMLKFGGRRRKKGKAFESGILIEDAAILEYDGPPDVAGLWADGRFLDYRSVKVSGKRVMRARPYFPTWALTFTVSYLPDQLDSKDIRAALDIAGQVVGLSDYRPKYGRFVVKEVLEV